MQKKKVKGQAGGRPGPKGGEASRFRFPSVLPVAKLGLALLALVGLPGGDSQLPGLLNPVVLGLPALNLSASSPTSAAVAEGVNFALSRANASGALPPLVDLNALLAENSPLGASVLATLPTFDAPAPEGADPLLADEGAATFSNVVARYDLNAAIHALNAFQLYDAGRIIQSIGHQLIADSALLYNNKSASEAVYFAGNELVSIGDLFEAGAAQEEEEAAKDVIVGLSAKELKTPSEPDGNSKASPAPTPRQDPFALAGGVDPGICYGTWQRLENTESQQLILYKVSRTEFVAINATTVDGRKAIRSQFHPGGVRCDVLSEGGLGDAPDQVQVTMLVDQPYGKPLVLTFSFLRASGAAVGKAAEVVVDVLVEQEGERKAYVRVSEF